MARTALITGVGPGTGTALVRRFAEGGYQVAMIARDEARLAALADEVDGARAYPCNVIQTEALLATLDSIVADLGSPEVVVHNAVGGAFGDFLSVDPAVLERNFQINTVALLHIAQRLVPAMIDAGHGAVLATGNTSAYRGRANFFGVCADQGRATDSAGIHGARSRSERRALRLCRHRRRHRPRMDT